MLTVEKHGNYSIIMYDDNLITIDYTDENIGVTIQTFNNENEALNVFENTVKTLSNYKARFHNTDIIKQIIS